MESAGTVGAGEYGELVRLRPFIFQKDYQNGEQIFSSQCLDTMKSLDDESFFVVRRTFDNQDSNFWFITFTLPENEHLVLVW